LACDLMEPVRPQVDAFVLDWITREPLSRQWFFEQRDGNCRLMAPLAIRLSETVPTWGRAVAPFAEWVARILWSTTSKSSRQLAPATRLTQRHRREAKGGLSNLPEKSTPGPGITQTRLPVIGMNWAWPKRRKPLACDLMEPVRPQVDAFVLDWITREPLRVDATTTTHLESDSNHYPGA